MTRGAAVLLAALACGRAETASETTPALPDSAGATLPGPAPGDDIVSRFAARLPEDLLRREGACPFECCAYRAWSEPVDLPLHSEPRPGPIVDTLPAGETFEAETGIVFVTGLLLVLPSDTLGVEGDPRPSRPLPVEWRPTWFPGDTLAVLDYVGEGTFHVWRDGEVHQVSQFWESEHVDLGPGPSRATTIGVYEAEWWIRARRADGTVGWFLQPRDATPDGADLCS